MYQTSLFNYYQLFVMGVIIYLSFGLKFYRLTNRLHYNLDVWWRVEKDVCIYQAEGV